MSISTKMVLNNSIMYIVQSGCAYHRIRLETKTFHHIALRVIETPTWRGDINVAAYTGYNILRI